jgi:glycolate oxidase FAD binding subunit
MADTPNPGTGFPPPPTATVPQSPDEFAQLLADAARLGRSTCIRGGGTKSGWGRPVPDADLTVSTAKLNQLTVHRHGDMTATVQAGMRLLDFNGALATHRQWLPVESAFPDATIGGIIATNDCGPMRHRSGTPRDLLIGITLALTDGRVVKAGGHVVKNVAGYDLGRLMSGSFGALAGIVDATFKLMPIPQAAATLVVEYADAPALGRDVAALMASQLEPAAFDVRSVRLQPDRTDAALQLLVRFASSPASTTEQSNHAAALLTGKVSLVTGQPEFDLWAEQLQAPWQVRLQPDATAEQPTVVRVSWLPASIAEVLGLVSGHAFWGRVMGTGLVRLHGDSAGHAPFIERLRSSRAVRHVVVLQAPRRVKEQVDAWGTPPSSAATLRALKQMFDPNGVLNPGRGPI